MTTFANAVACGAAHVIYSSEFADAQERRRGNIGGTANICNAVDPLTPAEDDPIIRPPLTKIDTARDAPLPEEPDASYEPIIATASSWHGGQETAMYAFASTREVQSEDHKAALLAEIANDIAWHDSHAEQGPGDLEKLRRLEAAVKAASPGAKFCYA